MKMKKYFILCIMIFLLQTSFAQTQEDLNNFNKERLATQKKAMVALGTWAVGNIAWGAVGVSTTEGATKEFHTMNILWNSINLAIAVPAYLGARKGKYELSFRQSYKEQQKVEKSFLINAGLDMVYITGGLYLKERSKKINHDRNLGYGQSLMLQGGFLLLLDTTLYTINVRHANKKLNGFLDKVTIGANGVGYIHRF